MTLQDTNFVVVLFSHSTAEGVKCPKVLLLLTAGDLSKNRQRLANLHHSDCKEW